MQTNSILSLEEYKYDDFFDVSTFRITCESPKSKPILLVYHKTSQFLFSSCLYTPTTLHKVLQKCLLLRDMYMTFSYIYDSAHIKQTSTKAIFPFFYRLFLLKPFLGNIK